MPKEYDVSIIIVNYHTAALVLNCITSIVENTIGINYEIIIVDNNSGEKDYALLETLSSENVRLIISDRNLGFGPANNVGIKEAASDYLFFLNPDTILCNNAIKILYDFMLSHENCGACGGNLYDSDLNPAHSHNIVFPGFREELDQAFQRKFLQTIFGKSTQHNFGRKAIEVAYITGADLMIRKKILDNVGCFDERFFMYYEETELQRRIKNAGFKIFNIPQSAIIHLEGKSFEVNYDREKRIQTSRKLYFEITHTKLYFWLLNFQYMLLNCLGYLINKVFRKDQKAAIFRQRIEILSEMS